MSIVLHLGAHKTATTHFQSRLYNSRDLLLKHNINYIPLSTLRREFTEKFCDDSLQAEVLDFLEPELAWNHVIISDENLTGWIPPLANDCSPYPLLAQRIARVLKLLNSEDVIVLYTIRDPIDYLLSRYFEYIRHAKFIEFDKYCSLEPIMQFSWISTIDQLRSLSVPVYVSDFSMALAMEKKYLQKFLPPIGLELALASQASSVRRAKLSRESYELLTLASARESPAFAKRLLKVMDATPLYGKSDLLEIIPQAIVKDCKKRYQSELSSLGITRLFRNKIHVRVA
jgi:hypothetical protein